jgi:hypothetical protein
MEESSKAFLERNARNISLALGILVLLSLLAFAFLPEYNFKDAQWIQSDETVSKCDGPINVLGINSCYQVSVADFENIKVMYNNGKVKISNNSQHLWSKCQTFRINDYVYSGSDSVKPYKTISVSYKDFLDGYDRLSPNFSKHVYGFMLRCEDVNGDARASTFKLD